MVIQIQDCHLQKGAMHMALDTTAPPPITEAAVPMPGHQRIKRILKKDEEEG